MGKHLIKKRQRSSDYKSKSFKEICWRRLKQEIEELKQPLFWKAVLAEFIGVTFLVCFALSSGMSDKNSAPNGLLFACLESGLFIVIIIGSLVHISGGHVNPVVSLAFLIVGDIGWIRCIFYCIAQILGSVAGAAMIYVIAPSSMHRNFGVITPGPEVTDIQAMFMEVLITFLLIFGILAGVDKGRTDSIGSVPLHVGIIVSVNVFASINISGGAMNPSRAFGPALIAGNWRGHWAYWVGPLTGSIIGSVLYDKVFSVRKVDSINYNCCLRTRDKNVDASHCSAEEMTMKTELNDVDAV